MLIYKDCKFTQNVAKIIEKKTLQNHKHQHKRDCSHKRYSQASQTHKDEMTGSDKRVKLIISKEVLDIEGWYPH